jgi:hypothetical protein
VTFTKALDNLIVIASLQTAFVALDEVLFPASRRAAPLPTLASHQSRRWELRLHHRSEGREIRGG